MNKQQWKELSIKDKVNYTIYDIVEKKKVEIIETGIVKRFNEDRTKAFVEFEDWGCWCSKEKLSKG